jgi:hypothetical protein
MRLKTKTILFLMIIVVVLSATSPVSAQRDTVRKKRLYPPAATVKGFIGGESHDSYVIRAQRGKTMTIKISWIKEADNNADFTVSRGANFFNAQPVNFGRESNGGKTWSGKIPATRDYYIYVVAHPTANYTLRVTVR